MNGINFNNFGGSSQQQRINPDAYAQQYANKNGISLEEAKAELKAKYGDPKEGTQLSGLNNQNGLFGNSAPENSYLEISDNFGDFNNGMFPQQNSMNGPRNQQSNSLFGSIGQIFGFKRNNQQGPQGNQDKQQPRGPQGQFGQTSHKQPPLISGYSQPTRENYGAKELEYTQEVYTSEINPFDIADNSTISLVKPNKSNNKAQSEAKDGSKDPEKYAKSYAEENNITLEEAKKILKSKMGEPQEK